MLFCLLLNIIHSSVDQMDLIKTIDENAEVEDFSEDSDAEVEVNKNQHGIVCNIFHNLLTTKPIFFSLSMVILVSTDKGASQEKGGIQW